jgi:carboxypeptidase family protein
MNFRSLKLSGLNISFSRVQTIVGLMAGILSITGFLVAFFKPAPDKGKLVTIVQDAKTERAVPGATIEVLTLADVLVTTLTPDSSGEARYTLSEGHYRVRVNHPQYVSEIRDVRLISGQNTEVRVQLRSGHSLSNAVRRVFHH